MTEAPPPPPPDALGARILACLVEKERTTPDRYPLSTNALTAACNQANNRDPVIQVTEREVDTAMITLRQAGLARTVSGAGHRTPKHRHVLHEALGLDDHELAVLAVLVLRGPQTLNEITTRTARYADGPSGDPAAVDAAVDRLAARTPPLVVRRERRPGEREPRIDQCWAPRPAGADSAPVPDPDETPGSGLHHAEGSGAAPADPAPPTRPDALAARVAALEARVGALERALGLAPPDRPPRDTPAPDPGSRD